ncbi:MULTISPECIES: alpha/beta fold hydrolase [Acinetobacter]|uniref:Alpha/beta hydrolase n=1 Tax=Acinetobacter ursingii TaxID=108980 RepID=A0A7T9UH01_9GAMM|nr:MULTISPECIES: alpha/beta hydrolase [Acinetobacter]ENX47909.1 hypothetical protein F943_02575 [Acinetobacter ursingii NIPH 706]EXD37001.1 alpha/beta hydrolase fold family protein [Acinetobacter sp. 479375]MCH2015361.1 alpha/beta hydrolase [Acinetobacter ursingii]MCU4522852.1 alpha/beta hydrolase [Acinetobacter ursingii]MCU4588250.1 alpha/beta hydrolase [Acinetobacter ursingii]
MPFHTMPDQEQLFVRRIGRGEPVVVLSGLGMVSWQWLPFIFTNLNKYEFIIPDWRGFGRSKNCAIPQELDAISSHWRDIETLIQQLNLQQFILIGYSMGATTAMHGMQHGNLAQQLKAYLHIDQTPKITVDKSWQFGLFGEKHQDFKFLLTALDDLLNQYPNVLDLNDLPFLQRQQLVQLWSEFIELQSSNKYSPMIFKLALNKPPLQKYLLPIQRIDYLHWYVKNYLNHQEDYRQAIAQLECPTTFFIGKNSSLYPVTGQTIIAKSVKKSQPIYFKRSGHTPLLTEPKKFSQEIRKFLNRLEAL